jgi:murein L,D-transpeptidase YafK
MDLIERRHAKDQTVRLAFASLLVSYCLLAIVTSAPKATLHYQDATYQPTALTLLQDEGQGLNPKRFAAITGPAGVPDEWWREHQKTALLREKWWQRYVPFKKAEPQPKQVRVASARIPPIVLRQEVLSEAVFRPQQVPHPKPIDKAAAKPSIVQDMQGTAVTPKAKLVEKPAVKPAVKPVIVASLSPLKLPNLKRPQKISYGDYAELLPAVINDRFKQAKNSWSAEPVFNHCVDGNIAGWSGIKPLSGHKELPRQSDSPNPQNVSLELQARLFAKGFTAGTSVFMRIFKDRSQLQVWLKKDEKYQLFHTYNICRWSGSFGPKLYEGDKQSPEGFYLVNRQLFNRPSFKWKGSFSIGYPNAYDKLHGRTGSLILVHGGCTSSGCFAMTNPVIKEVHELAQLARKNGQDKFSVNVYPFELTSANLEKHKSSPWIDFWKNLKTGYDLFEETRLPPRVRVCNKHYVFAKSGEIRSGPGWSGKGCYGLAARIPGWKQATDTRSRGRRAGRRCNLRRASCRKWVALRSKRSSSKRRKSSKRTRLSSKRRATMRRARAIGRKRK